jgi:hypothetical protein
MNKLKGQKAGPAGVKQVERKRVKRPKKRTGRQDLKKCSKKRELRDV